MALFFFFGAVGALIVVTLAAFLLHASRQWRRASGMATAQAKLPPGSMGLPYVGETLQLYSQNPNVFFATRQKRYGDIFKTNLLGYRCVMLASPEAAHFVLVSQAHLFKPTYPASKEQLIGPNALFFHQGGYHQRLRRLVQRSLGPDALRALVPDVDAAAAATLRAWDGGSVANTFHAMKRLSFDVGVVTIFGRRLDRGFKEELRRNYFVVERGYNSFPNRLPGSRYQKAIQARKGLRATLGEIVAARRAQRDAAGGECRLLDTFMQWRDDSGAALTNDQIADNVIGVLFAAQDTTASVLTWILKYLHDNPKLLEAVKEEQMEVYKENDGGKEPLTWAQTRGMPLTHRVIMESMRMASIISFTFREAVDDVEYNGFLIPKGWKVMPLFRNIHHSPEYFWDPQTFDPSRFMASPRPGTFLPFGSGVHACPGNELAKLEMLVLVHRLVTSYRWEVVGPSDEVAYSPFPVPRHGLKARLWSVVADDQA
ncbi:hypothetical protein EJB05_48725 [Eragrostis curvula]|uniref:(+)-abscisic acid 8'-hydroxylase n=1 Tax=Eragrostis curvula TaxID=38414 RepID=A0A5J9T2I7_9POAL|nr:hypothetical protein EJB05_48725 [Eragrostis curvula]